jgi:hypothetical protein
LIIDNKAHIYFTEILLLFEVGNGKLVDENCRFSLFANCKDLEILATVK